MTIPDPLDLPSGGVVSFRDSATHFKRSHYRRLAATIEASEDGTASFSARSETGWQVADLMAEALISSWRGHPKLSEPWYLEDRPVPGQDPSVLEDVSSADMLALGKHLVPLAFEILGFVTSDEADDQGKGERSEPPNGSTPISGSEASTARATDRGPLADREPTLSGALLIS